MKKVKYKVKLSKKEKKLFEENFANCSILDKIEKSDDISINESSISKDSIEKQLCCNEKNTKYKNLKKNKNCCQVVLCAIIDYNKESNDIYVTLLCDK